MAVRGTERSGKHTDDNAFPGQGTNKDRSLHAQTCAVVLLLASQTEDFSMLSVSTTGVIAMQSVLLGLDGSKGHRMHLTYLLCDHNARCQVQDVMELS